MNITKLTPLRNAQSFGMNRVVPKLNQPFGFRTSWKLCQLFDDTQQKADPKFQEKLKQVLWEIQRGKYECHKSDLIDVEEISPFDKRNRNYGWHAHNQKVIVSISPHGTRTELCYIGDATTITPEQLDEISEGLEYCHRMCINRVANYGTD